MTTKNYISAREIVFIVQGDRFYTVREVCDVAAYLYPEKITNPGKVRFRLTNLCASPRAKAEQVKFEGEALNRYRVLEVEEGYLKDSEARQNSSREATKAKPKVVKDPLTIQGKQEIAVVKSINAFDSLLRAARFLNKGMEGRRHG